MSKQSRLWKILFILEWQHFECHNVLLVIHSFIENDIGTEDLQRHYDIKLLSFD